MAIKKKVEPIDKNVLKAGAKALRDKGYSYGKIAEKLGIAKETARRYANINDEEVSQIKDLVTKHWLIRDFKLADRTIDRLEEKLKEDQLKPYDLIGLYKISRELQYNQRGKGTGTAIQININQDKEKNIVEVLEDIQEE